MAKFSMRRKVTPGAIISSIVGVLITLWVADALIKAVAASVSNVSNSTFSTAFSFIGITNGATGNVVSTTGILSVIGIIAFATILLRFVKINV